jgi:hypothetical protein
MKLTSVLCAIALVAAGSAIATPQPGAGGCSLIGTWYGGSGAGTPYLASFSPVDAGPYGVSAPERFAAEYRLAADLAPAGVASFTGWFGEAVRTGRRQFEVFVIAYINLTPEAAAQYGSDGSLPELMAVHSVVEMSEDCSVMTNTIDRYEDFLMFDSFTMVPFVTPPDIEYISLEGQPIVETYRRMPTALGTLPAYRATNGSSRAAASPKPLRVR